MIKDRFKNIGRTMGRDVEVFSLAIPEALREAWLGAFFCELGRISLQARKKGEPPLEGVYELEGLDPDKLDIPNNPTHVALSKKETIQGFYTVINKKNALRGIYGHFNTTAPFDESPEKPFS